nr:YceI family protein [uncultured Flavobacterium sp.]
MNNHVWRADSAHSQAGFTISHLGITQMSGFFKDFDITIQSDKEDFRDAQIKATIQINSLDTRIEERDHHLKAADFFDVTQFPIATIIGKRLINLGHGNHSLEAVVTIKGITKTASFELFYNGKAKNPMSQKTTAGFGLAGTLNRKDFGIGMEVPNILLGDLVSIEFNGEFVK